MTGLDNDPAAPAQPDALGRALRLSIKQEPLAGSPESSKNFRSISIFFDLFRPISTSKYNIICGNRKNRAPAERSPRKRRASRAVQFHIDRMIPLTPNHAKSRQITDKIKKNLTSITTCLAGPSEETLGLIEEQAKLLSSHHFFRKRLHHRPSTIHHPCSDLLRHYGASHWRPSPLPRHYGAQTCAFIGLVSTP